MVGDTDALPEVMGHEHPYYSVTPFYMMLELCFLIFGYLKILHIIKICFTVIAFSEIYNVRLNTEK